MRVPRDSVAVVSTGSHVVLATLMTPSTAAENVWFDSSPDKILLQFEHGSGEAAGLVLSGGSTPVVTDEQ